MKEECMQLTDDQKAALSAPIPSAQVSQRQGPGGKMLDYLEGWWVIAELNDILGPDGWSFGILAREWTEPPGGKGCSMIVTGRLELACGASREDIGYGDGRGPKGIELAVKEAATDALKRCARQLGHHLGGALYEKPAEDGARTHVTRASAAWARDAMQAVAELRLEAEAGRGSLLVAERSVAEHAAAIRKLPRQHKATVFEDLQAVAQLVTDDDPHDVAVYWITGQKPGKKE